MGLLIIAAFVIPVLLAWLVLRKRDRVMSGDDYGGPEDEAPPHEVTLR